jgi:hypothetical protein
MAKPFQLTLIEGVTEAPLKPGWHKRALAAEKRSGPRVAPRKGSSEADANAFAYAKWLLKRDGVDVSKAIAAAIAERVTAHNADLPMRYVKGRRGRLIEERASPMASNLFRTSREVVWTQIGKEWRVEAVEWIATDPQGNRVVGYRLTIPGWDFEPSCVETVDDGDDAPGGSDDSGEAAAPVLAPVAEPDSPIACDGASVDAIPEPVDPVPTPSPTPADPAPTRVWAVPVVVEWFGLSGAAIEALPPVEGIRTPDVEIVSAPPVEAIPLAWSPDASSHPVVIHCLSDASFDAMARLILDGAFPAETQRGKAGSFRLTLDDALRCERLKSVRLSGMPRKPYPKRTPVVANPYRVRHGAHTPAVAIAGRAVTLHAPSL